jgi:phenylacetate-coenzyme A ligase PaaK-like adenylate-forming protein
MRKLPDIEKAQVLAQLPAQTVDMGPVFDRLLFAATALDVRTAGWATAKDIEARQKVRLSRLLHHLAHGKSLYAPYLRDYLDGSVQLQMLPVFHRSELMQRFDEWVTDPQISLTGLTAFTADSERIGKPYLGKYTVWKSSGSSGQPCQFVQDRSAMAVYDALEAYRRSPPSPLLRSLDPLFLSERIAFVGATGGHFASVASVRRLADINPWTSQVTRSMSIMQPTWALVAELNAYEPSILATYPTVASMLVEQTAMGALHIAPREIWTGGETLSSAARARIEAVWNSTVRNHYGASEFLSIASECSHRQMHVNCDWVILEPVDEHYKPVPLGHESATTLLTNLANTVQPLVRYDMQDEVAVSNQPCACGSPLPVIRVVGRNDAPLTLRSANDDAVVLLPMALTTVLEEQAGLFEFQLRQRDAQTLELAIPQSGTQGDEAMQRGCAALQEFLHQHGLVSTRIVRQTGAVLRQGSSGKTARVLAA